MIAQSRLRVLLMLATLVACGDEDVPTAVVPPVDPPADPVQPPDSTAMADSAVAADRAALVAVYDATGGGEWRNDSGWATDAPLGDWHGVRTDDAGRVVSLNLSRNNLTGSLPPEIGDLNGLGELLLSRNALTGTLPASLLTLGLTSFNYRFNGGICAPGTREFADWLEPLEVDGAPPGLYCNKADYDALQVLYESAGGDAWTAADGWTDGGDYALGDRHGVEADSLGRVLAIDLAGNGLAGRLPSALGALPRLGHLDVSGNEGLEGRLPLLLGKLSLDLFRYSGTGLCAPADAGFVAWLSAIGTHEGTGTECPPLSSREALTELYHAAGGPEWPESGGWLSDDSLADWHGVTADGAGEVTGLMLRGNGLTGVIPPELGGIASLQALDLEANDLQGEIPAELGQLTGLSVLSLGGNRLSGSIPAELGDLASLTVLRLGGNFLSGSIPPELGRLANLRELILQANQLTGAIPAELGGLASLRSVVLSRNSLSGAIPSELVRLGSLGTLVLAGNNLSGPIPPAIGQASSLAVLNLAANELTGPIPSEIGQTPVSSLTLSSNRLEGSVPPEIGQLTALRSLSLFDNRLTGAIPPELGQLATVAAVLLNDNELSGPLPPELGNMAELRVLALSNNAGLEGPIPAGFASLQLLESFHTGGTMLCAPDEIRAWLEGIPKQRVASCSAAVTMAYLVQAVQSREFPVPLVAGEEALLRVFPTAARENGENIPRVVASFYRRGEVVHTADIQAKSGPIPQAIDEASLATSANATIPAEFIQPGTEMAIEVDPDGTLPSDLGVARRIPETGTIRLDVRPVLDLSLTLIPFVAAEQPDSSVIDLVAAMAVDSAHELLRDTHTLLPIRGLTVQAHEPVISDTYAGGELLQQTIALRVMEGGAGYYMGIMSHTVAGPRGIAQLGKFATVSVPEGRTIAHELGHNLNLQHAPCGGPAGLDLNYPYADGTTGSFGYNHAEGETVDAGTLDIMSYCGPHWISDYHFSNAFRHRLNLPADTARVGRSTLMVWGGVDPAGDPFLEPAIPLEVPPVLPDSAGDWHIVGRHADGGELFRVAFAMPAFRDGDGAGFAWAIPSDPAWADDLARIELEGPGGAASIDRSTDRPVTILRSANGKVRAFLRGSPPAGVAEQSILYSRGIPFRF